MRMAAGFADFVLGVIMVMVTVIMMRKIVMRVIVINMCMMIQRRVRTCGMGMTVA